MKVKTHNADHLKRTSKIRERASRTLHSDNYPGALTSSHLLSKTVVPSDQMLVNGQPQPLHLLYKGTCYNNYVSPNN